MRKQKQLPAQGKYEKVFEFSGDETGDETADKHGRTYSESQISL
jgi:hypothetical protein